MVSSKGACRFRSELEIMTKRRDHMLQEVSKIDEDTKLLMTRQHLPKEVELIAIERWEEVVKQNMEETEREEEIKKSSTIEAHKKDETYYRKHQIDRLKNKNKKSNTEKKNTADTKSKLTSGKTNEEVIVPEFELVVVENVDTNNGLTTTNSAGCNTVNEAVARDGGDEASKNDTIGEDLRRSQRISSTCQGKT